jgi:hypothetical protein
MRSSVSRIALGGLLVILVSFVAMAPATAAAWLDVA